MSKPWNPLDRPMSLDESEALLKAEAYERQSREEWKVIGLCLAVMAGLAWLLYSFGSLALDILGQLFR